MRAARLVLLSCVTSLAFLSCGGSATPTLVEGVWGGDGVSLRLSATGGSASFCCASGTITQAVVLDASGSFDVSGTYLYQAGPVRVGGPVPVPARYQGTVSGSSMTLYVVLSGQPSLGPLTLGKGNPGSIICPCPLIAAS